MFNNRNKKLLSWLLILTFFMSSLPQIPVQASDDNYISIHTAEDLDNVRNNTGGKYKLENDIDLSDYISKTNTADKGWYPIGYGNFFTGILDGKGHTIRGLWSSANWGIAHKGLFSVTMGAEIRNLNIVLDDRGITGAYEVGGITGDARNGTIIENCTVSGGKITVTAGDYAGGIVGFAYVLPVGSTPVIIKDCMVDGTYISTSGKYSGGIIGVADCGTQIIGSKANDVSINAFSYGGGIAGALMRESTIEDSYATGNVTGVASYHGGLVGVVYENSHIKRSISKANVNANHYGGGLVGSIYGKSSISQSAAYGDVETKNYIAGGLVGEVIDARLDNTYARGNVIGTTGVGGLVGYFSGSGGTQNKSVENSYSSGQVTGTGSTEYGAFSGRSGVEFKGYNYYDIDTAYAPRAHGTAGLPSGDSYSFPQGKSTVDMMSKLNFVGWDFENVWSIDEGKDYPMLRFNNQPVNPDPVDEEIYFKELESLEQLAIEPETGLEYIKNEIMVTAKLGVPKETMETLFASYGGKVVGYISMANDYQVELNTSNLDDINLIVATLNQHEDVLLACLHYVMEITKDSYLPPYSSDDYDWSIAGSDIPTPWDVQTPMGYNWNLEAIKAPWAWMLLGGQDQKVGLGKVNVGIIDAVFQNHQEFTFDGLFYNDPTLSQDNHGNMVTGIIAAKRNDAYYPHPETNHNPYHEMGMSGVSSPDGLYGVSYVSDRILVERSLYFQMKVSVATLLSHEVKVINLSSGFSDNDIGRTKRNGKIYGEFLNNLIKNNFDFLIVQSAGNTAQDATNNRFFSKTLYSQVNDRILTVGDIQNDALDPYEPNPDPFSDPDSDRDPECHFKIPTIEDAELIVKTTYSLASYPLYNRGSNYGKRVDLVAPGKLSYTTSFAFNEYHLGNGTSAAAPHVSGVAVMVWQANPSLTGEEVKEIVVSSADHDPNIVDPKGGIYSVLNAYEAVKEAITRGGGTPTPFPDKGIIMGHVQYVTRGGTEKSKSATVIVYDDVSGVEIDRKKIDWLGDNKGNYEFIVDFDPSDTMIGKYKIEVRPDIISSHVPKTYTYHVDFHNPDPNQETEGTHVEIVEFKHPSQFQAILHGDIIRQDIFDNYAGIHVRIETFDNAQKEDIFYRISDYSHSSDYEFALELGHKYLVTIQAISEDLIFPEIYAAYVFVADFTKRDTVKHDITLSQNPAFVATVIGTDGVPVSTFATSVYDDTNNLISTHVSYDGLLYLSLDPGAYRVEVNDRANGAKTEYLNVSLYETVIREIQLLEKADTGIIEVEVAQANANIRLIYGIHYLPVPNYPKTIPTDNYTFHVNNNKYLLVVTAPGHEPYTEEITINGQTERRDIDLNPLEDADDRTAVFAFAGEYPYTHVFARASESYDVPAVKGNAAMAVKPNSYGYLFNVFINGKEYTPQACISMVYTISCQET